MDSHTPLQWATTFVARQRKLTQAYSARRPLSGQIKISGRDCQLLKVEANLLRTAREHGDLQHCCTLVEVAVNYDVVEGFDQSAAIAAALGIRESDIGFDSFEPGRWSAGVEFNMIPLRSRDAVARARPMPDAWDAAFSEGNHSAYLFSGEAAEEGHAFHARMFGLGLGISEDPATGAVGCFTESLSSDLPELTKPANRLRVGLPERWKKRCESSPFWRIPRE